MLMVKKAATLRVRAQFAEWFLSDFDSLRDFDNMYYFTKTPLPEGAVRWKSDESFGNQRLSGCNPVVIELCQQIPKR